MKKQCARIQPLISEWINGLLSVEDERKVEEHVNACPECSAMHDRLMRAVTAVRSLPSLSVSPEFTPRLRERLEQVPPRSRIAWRWPRWTWVAAPTLGIAVLALTFWLSRPTPTSTPAPSDTSSLYVMECLEQHAAYASGELMAGGTALQDEAGLIEVSY